MLHPLEPVLEYELNNMIILYYDFWFYFREPNQYIICPVINLMHIGRKRVGQQSGKTTEDKCNGRKTMGRGGRQVEEEKERK